MRIVHLIRSDGWAGVERHVVRLAVEQARSGHSVKVIGGNEAITPHCVRGTDVGFVAARTTVDAVTALQRSAAPDILHVHMTAAEVAAYLAPRMRQVPVVSTRHFASLRGARLASRPIVRAAARRIAAQIAVSQYVADRIEDASTVILAGVEPPPVPPITPERTRVVLLVQRLEPEKKTDLALQAFAASDLAASGWRLEVAGSGSLERQLRGHAVELGIGDEVRFLGRRTDVAELMCAAAILLAPRDDEAYGISVVEAMAAALPVVAAGAAGHLETVGRVSDAALFPPGDHLRAAKLLRELAEDPERRARYGKRLQEVQRRKLSVAEQARATELVYKRVL